MVVYKVFYKDYANEKGVFLWSIAEAEKNMSEKSPLESVLRSARLAYADKVEDKKDIFVVPKEMGAHLSVIIKPDMSSELNSSRSANPSH
jgi:hypothetical protein